jgi:hypothetical protein
MTIEMRDGDRLAMVPVSLSGGIEPGARTGTSVGGQASAAEPRDTAARCLSVPAHPGMTPPGKAVVTALPVVEALGMMGGTHCSRLRWMR